MVRAICVLLAGCLIWLNALPASSHLAVQTTVNAVIGDISYYERFGRLPTEQDDETLRIRTHLSYVEKILRSRVPSTVPADLMPRRQQMLNLLHSYHQQGIFPSQSAYEGRRPNFIDEQGRICAVGYLVAQTAGMGLAREIDKAYSYAYLPEMKSPKLAAWAAKSGLTTEELAMIQPTYYTPSEQNSMAIYGTGVTVLGLSQFVLMVVHMAALNNFSAEYYVQTQTADQILTLSTLGALVLMLTLPLLGLGVLTDLITYMMTGLVTLALGIPNLLMLYQLDYLAHQKPEPVSLGWFQTPDQQSAWGLHASLSF